MKHISKMEDDELRALLGIGSVLDRDIQWFAAWDEKHLHRDYYRADSRREDVAEGLTSIAFAGDGDDDEINDLYKLFRDDPNKIEAAIKLADELINSSTYTTQWEKITTFIDEYSDITDRYAGVDAYVDSAKFNFAAELFSGGIEPEQLKEIFAGKDWEAIFIAVFNR